MQAPAGFRLPRYVLPRPGIDWTKWAVVACDQYTSEPEYWREVEGLVGAAPSTLRLIFPEVFLGAADGAARIGAIQAAMRAYLDQGLLQDHEGAVYVERRIGARTRRGLMLELDLDHYDYAAASTSLVRPTEGTIVARLAPRIEVRRGAELELPHVLVLIDDPSCTVIEPLAAVRDEAAALYDFELMQGGGHVAGHRVDAARAERAVQALGALAEPRAFAARYGVAEGTPAMLFAVGDGNHSLATAKSIWEASKARLGPDHPSRWALVEVENIHDPALEFEPIHRLLFGVKADLRRALAEAFGPRLVLSEMADASEMRRRVAAAPETRPAVGLVEPGGRFALAELADPPSGLAVACFQPFVDGLIERGGAAEVDYVHGDDTLERLAQAPGHAGLHFPVPGKSALLRRVVHEGPLPRKTFSMGEAHEKRYYVEARRIRRPGD